MLGSVDTVGLALNGADARGPATWLEGGGPPAVAPWCPVVPPWCLVGGETVLHGCVGVGTQPVGGPLGGPDGGPDGGPLGGVTVPLVQPVCAGLLRPMPWLRSHS